MVIFINEPNTIRTVQYENVRRYIDRLAHTIGVTQRNVPITRLYWLSPPRRYDRCADTTRRRFLRAQRRWRRRISRAQRRAVAVEWLSAGHRYPTITNRYNIMAESADRRTRKNVTLNENVCVWCTVYYWFYLPEISIDSRTIILCGDFFIFFNSSSHRRRLAFFYFYARCIHRRGIAIFRKSSHRSPRVLHIS